MRELGLAMLFGLCCAVGMRLGAQKTARLKTVRSLIDGLRLFRERIGAGQERLSKIAAEDGVLFDCLRSYLDALERGRSEADAANEAIESLKSNSAEATGVRAFFYGLSETSRNDLLLRVQALESALERAAEEAESGAKQARVLRLSGALVGAGLTILLL